MQEKVSWGIMLIVSIALIVIGFQGALGRMLACVVTPSEVVINA